MPEPAKTVIESYEPSRFIEWAGWQDISRLLESRGVCVGVGGARGAGKTWLLRHAERWAKEREGIGVYFPSPSAYDASVFLSGLCQKLATEVEGTLRPPTYLATQLRDLVARQNTRVVISALAAATTVTSIEVLGDSARQIAVRALLAALVGLISYAFLSSLAALSVRSLEQHPERSLYLRALAIQRWIQYSSATKTASEFAVEAGKGLIAKGKVSEELALSERPVTELALINEFRSLAEDVARAGFKVVIAIDELDKIGSVEDVRRLLRSVKGVLDPSGVVLLVSVSDEAVTHLGLGGLRGRDEISSSFGTMLHVPPLTIEQCRKLTEHAVGTCFDALSDAIWVMTAGNQREVIRQLDDCLHAVAADRTKLVPELAIHLASKREREDFASSLVADTTVGHRAKTSAYSALAGLETQQAAGSSHVFAELAMLWDPTWADSEMIVWPSTVHEHWQRFLVRSALLRILVDQAFGEKHSKSPLSELRSAFELSQHSAGVALEFAGRHFAEIAAFRGKALKALER